MAQPNIFRLDFPDGEVLKFKYTVVQLNRLTWRRFVDSDNPVGSALMAKIKLAELIGRPYCLDCRSFHHISARSMNLMITC